MAIDYEIHKLILEEALKWGNIQEIRGNQGFKNEEFEKRIREAGWQLGQAWCAYAAELVWVDAYRRYNEILADRVESLFSASATATFNSFDLADGFKTGKYPDYGAIIIWRKYYIDDEGEQPELKASWKGHAGIVIDSVYAKHEALELIEEGKPFEIQTVEGNTNSEGGREGVEFTKMWRDISFEKKPGLVPEGFIYPIT